MTTCTRPSPAALGTHVLREGPGGTQLAVGAALGRPDEARFLSHFATCPNAARHRRGR